MKLMAKRQLLVTVLIMSMVVFFAAPLTAYAGGVAVWTTDSVDEVQDGNIYASKDAVYVHAKGFTGDTLYVTVKAPGGKELGSGTVARGTGDETVFQLWAVTNYIDTTNTGGEYKVIVKDDNRHKKSDNFKVESSVPELGGIKIMKNVPNVTDSDVDFDFTVYSANEAVVGTGQASEVSPMIISDLAPGTYLVVEDQAEGYTTDELSQEVTVEAGSTAKVTFVNTKDTDEDTTGSIKIIKDVPNVTDSHVMFDFTIYNANEDVVATGQACEVDPLIISDLDPGTYLVEETQAEGYTTKALSQEVTVVAGDTAPVTFENTLNNDQVTSEAGISIDKTVDPTTVTSKTGTVTYTFVVTNTGDYDLYGVSINDADINYYLYIGDLAMESSTTASITFDLSNLGTEGFGNWNDAYQFVNTADVTGYYGEKEDSVTDSDDAIVTYNDPETLTPSISIVKDVNDDDSTIVHSRGASVTYTFTVKNTGDFDLYGVTIDDSDIDYNHVIGYLAVGATTTASVTFDLSNLGNSGFGDWDGNKFVNTADVSGYTRNEASVSDTDDATVNYRSNNNNPPEDRTVTPEPTPAGPVVETPIIEQPIPAAPLPATGGVAPYLVYGLGMLLASGGLAFRKKENKDK